MATDYTLQLKATLDASDVQDKLNQLKEQQQSTGGVGNGIPQALQRLNATLTNLQRSIDRLSTGLGKDIRSTGSGGRTGMPIAAGAARQTSVSPKAPAS